jgi:AAA domain
MIVMINGSFGVGKTTIAKLLRRSLPGSMIYDPEWIGFIINRLPGWIRSKSPGSWDYQNIFFWRRATVTGVRLFSLLAPRTVIVPMTFSNREYFDEIVTAIRQLDSELRVFCLRASLATVKKRLIARGTKIEGPGSEWIARRIVECVEAHKDTYFGEPVDTEGHSARHIADDILKRLK